MSPFETFAPSFETVAEAGEARRGRLTVNGRTLETPHLFPVINFYGGGNEDALFGGGIHRTIKQFMVNYPPVVGENDYSDHFSGVLTSVASLTDYGIREKKLDYYLDNKIREWDRFSSYEGVIFIDSGGYKLLKEGGLKGEDFKKDVDQDKAFEMQMNMGADIVVNLDHPIHPDDDHKTKKEKMKTTAANARRLIELSHGFEGARYLTVHGYNQSMLERSFGYVQDQLDEDIDDVFDGIALGSLVPRKDSVEALIEAVGSCKRVMQQKHIDHLPLHVFGISGSAMPLLAALGADTFDSAAYLHQAVNGKYCKNLFETVPVQEADFTACDCQVCSDRHLRESMRGDEEYQKDILGPVAVHNLAVQQRELQTIRQTLAQGDEDALTEYLENAVRDQKNIQKFAYRVINETLTPYF